VPNWDHIVPYSYSYSNADDNFVAACSICNSFKSSHVFENIIECKSYLKKRWDKHLRLRKIVLLEDDSLEIEKNCKKNSLSYV
jgi:CRISPR/Cas system Type II protein with McrA/HNH and RuvC-like nuclease domain